MNGAGGWWLAMLEASAKGSVLIALVWSLRFVFRRRWPAQCFHLLWLLVFLRLLLPTVPSSSWSVFNVRHWWTAAPEPEAPVQWRVTLEAPPEETPQAAVIGGPTSNVVAIARPPMKPADWIPWIWLGGVAFQWGLLAMGSWRLDRTLAQTSATASERVWVMARECASVLGLTSLPRIVETTAISGPAVVGWWRPRLLLPSSLVARLSEDDLRCVLLHELAHVGRYDLAALWLQTVARTVHWFNPLVWLAARYARRDLELACDARVLRSWPGQEATSYGGALLRLVELTALRPTALPAAGIVESRSALQERLDRIRDFSPGSSRGFGLMIAVVLGAGALFGADEKPPAPFTEKPAEPAPAPMPASTATPTAPAPKVDRKRLGEGWTVTELSLHREESASVSHVRIRPADGPEFTLFGIGANHDGVILDRVDWSDADRPQVHLRRDSELAVLGLPGTEKTAAPGAEGPFGTGWKVVGITQPARDNEGRLQVHLVTPAGASLAVDTFPVNDDGFWVEVTTPPAAAEPLSVLLHHAGKTAQFPVDRSLLLERPSDAAAARQMVFEATFVTASASAVNKLRKTHPELCPPDPGTIDEKLFGVLAHSNPAPPPVVSLAGVFTAGQWSNLRQALEDHTSGLDIMDLPRLTTRPGQHAVVDLIHEFRYATDWEKGADGSWKSKAMESKNCGLSLGVDAIAGPDGYTLDVNITPQFTAFLGFLDGDSHTMVGRPQSSSGHGLWPTASDFKGVRFHPRMQPIFSTSKITTSVSIFENCMIMLTGHIGAPPKEAVGKQEEPRRFFIFLTARQMGHEGQTWEPAAAAADQIAVAEPVKEKPGYVLSPFAPKSGYIDVRGFAAGTQVKCPYTGQTFLVP